MSDFTPKPGQFCWQELVTPNPEQAKAFYSELLGWEPHDIDMGPEGTYTIFKQGNQEIAGMLKTPAECEEKGVPPHWMSFLLVESIDDTIAKCEQLGATILNPKQEVPNYGWFAAIQDPTGAHISFWQKA